MITECYIKGRYDYGVGKSAVVITEDVKCGEEKKVLHQVAWTVPGQWEYEGNTVVADQYNCEILAACYALQWCMTNHKNLVNIYSNNSIAEKWYLLCEFPKERIMGKAYKDAVQQYHDYLENTYGTAITGPIFAEQIMKSCNDARYMEYNRLVNSLAMNVK